jgi:hypothetical protein
MPHPVSYDFASEIFGISLKPYAVVDDSFSKDPCGQVLVYKEDPDNNQLLPAAIVLSGWPIGVMRRQLLNSVVTSGEVSSTSSKLQFAPYDCVTLCS